MYEEDTQKDGSWVLLTKFGHCYVVMGSNLAMITTTSLNTGPIAMILLCTGYSTYNTHKTKTVSQWDLLVIHASSCTPPRVQGKHS